MRVLLLDNKTKLYFKSAGSWTAEPEAAQDFGNSLQAALFAEQHCLDEAQVFLDFGDQEYNVYLPVAERLRHR